MEGVYKSSTKVLVLDRTLADVPSYGMLTEEIGLRIMCSGWARRLWTLQEGLHQAQVHYQFADTTYTYKDLNEAMRKKHAFPTRSVTVPETHSLRKLLANPPHCAYAYEPLACFAHKALSCCWPRISSFFKELDIKYSQPDPDWFPGMQLVPGMTVLVPRAMRTIAYRTTSRSEDEGIILASLTDWRVGSAGPLTEVPAEERMRVCFKQFAVVPSQLIFLDQKRYEDTGARWIPKSLLAQSSKGTNPLPYKHSIISDEFSWPSSRGITAEYPSFRLSLPPNWNHKKYNQTVLLHMAGKLYKGFVHKAGSQDAPESLPYNLALIVPRSINAGPWNCIVALVSILNANALSLCMRSTGFMARLLLQVGNALANYHDKSRMIGRHEALLDLERVPEGQGVDERLPRVDAVAMTEFLTVEENIPWRIG
ncbi:het domain-containing protein [Fusarium mundagurra]|uniref:Het domain-containing protein n=1 Tax=Fusarium mundagurra TaxID=1567541 RepID=A0A8H5Z0R7_9HYPO|nr:het domain-containing protein [Fusarium mundagurra]